MWTARINRPIVTYQGRLVELLRDHADGRRTNGKRVDHVVIREADGQIHTVRRNLVSDWPRPDWLDPDDPPSGI